MVPGLPSRFGHSSKGKPELIPSIIKARDDNGYLEAAPSSLVKERRSNASNYKVVELLQFSLEPRSCFFILLHISTDVVWGQISPENVPVLTVVEKGH